MVAAAQTTRPRASSPSAAPVTAATPLFLPHLQGERTPLWDAGARGVFAGVSGATGPAELAASVLEGVAFSARLGSSLGMARLHDMLLYPGDIEALRLAGVEALRELESHLTEARFAGRIFLVGDGPTIADIACFPNVALAPDGGVSLDDYPSIRLWSRAVRALPGFIEMPGIHRLHELKPAPEAVPPLEDAL